MRFPLISLFLLVPGCFLFEPIGPPAASPEPLASPGSSASEGFRPRADRDGDGITDDLDRCPDDPEDRDGFEDEDGCPDPDNDKDGILDRCDRCPNDPEIFNGFEDQDGCPDRAVVRVQKASIRIIDAVYFTANRAEIRPQSGPLLDEIARVLSERPDIELVGCLGHASSDEAQPDLLGMRRGEAVRAGLMKRGVDPHRLAALSAGARRPLADEKAASGRERNRRADFHLMVVDHEEVLRWDGSNFVAPPPTSPPVPVAPALPPVTGCP